MKKRLNFIKVLLMVLTAFGSFNVAAQTACGIGSHPVFAAPADVKPVLLNKLGTKPQFGEIPQHTAASAFSHLNEVYTSNLRDSKAELDLYFRALGYTGFKDPAFTASKITPEILAKGKTGWMGAFNKRHKYAWSVLGNDFESFKISSKTGACYGYIMKKCGNAFYTTSCIPCSSCDPNRNDKVKCPAEKVAAANAQAVSIAPTATCKTQTISFAGSSKIKGGDVVNTTTTLPLVATLNNETVCLGDFTVPVRVTYEMSASGDVNYSKTVEVCDMGAGVVSNNRVNLPLTLGFNLVNSNVKVGDDGRMNMVVDAKQFAALKSAFGTCNSTAPTSAANSFTKSMKNTDAKASSFVGGGNPANCVKQMLQINGSAENNDMASKTSTQQVTIVGHYKGMGNLAKGESADKYLCLGNYSIPATTNLQYKLTGKTNMEMPIEVCDNGKVNPVEVVSVPVKLTSNLSKSDIMIGDYGKVIVNLTKEQYNKLSKSYGRCCTGGSSSTCN